MDVHVPHDPADCRMVVVEHESDSMRGIDETNVRGAFVVALHRITEEHDIDCLAMRARRDDYTFALIYSADHSIDPTDKHMVTLYELVHGMGDVVDSAITRMDEEAS